MSDPTDLREELASLTADARALLEDAWLRGARNLPVEGPGEGAGEETAGPAAPQAAEAASGGEAVAGDPTRWAAWAQAARAAPVPPAQALQRIRDELGDCRRCGLCQGRRNIVFGVGDPAADLVVVGEGPGRNEDLQGEPFVGDAGQMLDRMLVHVLGLQRSEVYICNVVKCRPPDNRDPRPDEVAACLPFLERQIEALAPKVILVLGRVALQSLFGANLRITRARGQWTEWRGVPTLPTFHPAYLLRKPQDKRLVFEDLKALRARYDALGGRRAG